jgi:hypothetical protein
VIDMMRTDLKTHEGTKSQFMTVARTMLSVIATNPDNTMSVIYQKTDSGYLCLIKKTGMQVEDKPIAVPSDSFEKVMNRCASEKWFFQLFKKTGVITG